jgi:hypothetical protein
MKLAYQTQPKQSKGVVDSDKLDSMLADLETEHNKLLDLAHAHKDALTQASVEELRDITIKTSDVLMRVASIEDRRRAMIERDTGSLGTLDQLIEQMNPTDQDRIGKRRSRLRELILRVQEEQSAVRQASEHLASHMQGLIKQVSASLSHSGTYSRGGAVDPSRSQVVSSLDVVQ